jgi:hypothetical protein
VLCSPNPAAAPKTAHEAHAAVAFPSHFVAFRRISVAFCRISVAFCRISVAFFAFLFHPLPAITAYTTCPYARFPVNRLSHFSHFPAATPCRVEKTKSEKRKMKIPLFLVFRSPAHRTMCLGTHDIVCA